MCGLGVCMRVHVGRTHGCHVDANTNCDSDGHEDHSAAAAEDGAGAIHSLAHVVVDPLVEELHMGGGFMVDVFLHRKDGDLGGAAGG